MRRRIGLALIVLGLVVVAWIGVTIAWGDPFTSLYTRHEQGILARELRTENRAWQTQAVQPAAGRGENKTKRTTTKVAQTESDETLAVLGRRAKAFARSLTDGAPIGRIVIPRINLDMVVVQGTTEGDLAKGPGHYDTESGENTALPGGGAVVAIAGHRTTFLHPFRHVDELKPGDNIYLEMPYGTFRYRVYFQKIVVPTDWTILRKRSYEKLVLSACHPLYSASHRIVTFARLEGWSTKSVL